VTERVDASVDAVQPACRHSIANAALPKPDRDQLSIGDNAVLAPGELGQRPITW
jgi:hypothetical protein